MQISMLSQSRYARNSPERKDNVTEPISVLKNKLNQYEKELEYQVSHKRIAYLQEQITELEKEIADRTERLMPEMTSFMKLYDKGDRIFYSALHRKFGNDTSDVIELIAENGYGTKSKLYLCPECAFATLSMEESEAIAEGRLQEEVLFCTACDAEFKAKNAIEEPMLIRTDKQAE